jgi:Holliday junction resolvasome RuvABC endonuclease subunit
MHHQHNASPCAILALDLGTTTGWALSLPDHSVTHGFVSFKPQRFEGGGMRCLRFRRWLDEVLATTAPSSGVSGLDAVYFEEVRRHLGVDAAHAYGGFLATLTSRCEHQKIPYQGVPVGTIKRHVTGKGNAGKSEMVSAMRSRGYVVADDNEADALAVLVWALAQGNGRCAGGARHG